jgi:hypothetical protein
VTALQARLLTGRPVRLPVHARLRFDKIDLLMSLIEY